MKLQWEKYGKNWAGLDGNEVVCIVGPAEGAPLEMYQLQFLNGCYTTLESAQAAAEEDQPKPPSINDWLVPILKQTIAHLETPKPASVGG